MTQKEVKEKLLKILNEPYTWAKAEKKCKEMKLEDCSIAKLFEGKSGLSVAIDEMKIEKILKLLK